MLSKISEINKIKKCPPFVSSEKEIKNIFISTYPPVKCGLATFTKDLTTAINMLNPNELSRIVSVNPPNGQIKYPWEVYLQINKNDPQSYVGAAKQINKSKYDIVCLQHEYGIFGGKDGEYVLLLAKNLKVPLVVTFHTVLENPSPNQKRILKKLAEIAKVIVVMVRIAQQRLSDIYGVDLRKATVIPHGIPDYPFGDNKIWKSLLDIRENQYLIGTFGLLSPNKGYEYLIKAFPSVLKKHPRAILLIAGETHPLVKLKEGEAYRQKLIDMTEKLGIGKSVHFANKYFSLEELVSIIKAFDIFVCPSINPQQISSGTLAYAIGIGKACVSTSFAYAKEILASGKGVLIPFRNSEKIASGLISLLDNPEETEKIAQGSYLIGRKMTWVKVADSYLDVFKFLRSIYGKKSS